MKQYLLIEHLQELLYINNNRHGDIIGYDNLFYKCIDVNIFMYLNSKNTNNNDNKETDKEKIKDLSKKQKGLSKKNKDFIEKINKMSKDKSKEPADKIETALLKSQMQQTSVDGMKIAVQKNQLALKAKLKTIKKRSKA